MLDKFTNKSSKENIINLFVGFLAGLASLMPGISGGTILVITQKYDRLLKAANNLMRFKFDKQELKFFLWIMSGAVIAVLSLSRLMAFLLKRYEYTIIIFFVGLILGGVWILSHETNLRKANNLFLAIISFLLTAPIFLYLSENIVNESNQFPLWYLILGGAFASFCWVLPGISGSATLVMLGLYQPIMAAVAIWDLAFLFPIGIGVVVGGILCVKLLVALFECFRQQGMAILLGLTLGGVWGLINFEINPFSIILIVSGILVSLLVEKALG